MDLSFSRVCIGYRVWLISALNGSSDFHHIDLLAHFDRERIPERVVSPRTLYKLWFVPIVF